MAFDVSRARWFSVASVIALSTALGAGCAVPSDADSNLNGETPEVSDSSITEMDHTEVKRQSIGNCWLYSTASWLESLNKTSTGVAANTSESYLTYWHWFEQIANSSRSEVSTGGSWRVAANLINRYGLMLEKDFIPSEENAAMSARQASALAAINTSLKTGALMDPASRTREAVRDELDKAWGLDAEMVKQLDAAFGPTVSKTIDRKYRTTDLPAGSKIIRAQDFPVRLRSSTSAPVDSNLLVAIGRGTSDADRALAWRTVSYPYDAASRRAFQKRIQRALHDGQPAIMSWHVDFNALSSASTFSIEEMERRGTTGSQGGHMVVLHDYEIDNVPGFGTLPATATAGTTEKKLETRPEALTAALDDAATIKFFRVKNSWGAARADRWNTAAIGGYHDLYMTYLDGPVKNCEQGTKLSECESETSAFWDVTLPPGY